MFETDLIKDSKTGEALKNPSVALRCANLIKRYTDVVAVDGLDLEVFAGECFGLLGPNGAGKTTTVEILEGLTPSDSGTVEILGTKWGTNRDRELRERIGAQLQETQLSEKLTVEETVRLFRSFYREGRDVDELIKTVELDEKRKARVGKLSGGQKQRLAVACSLAGAPDLLFLDEPTTGLDPQARLKLWEIVEKFRAHGGTILLTTHYMEEAARLCDRIGIMDHGRLIALGTPAELIESLGGEQVVRFSVRGELDTTTLESLPSVRRVNDSSVSGEYSLTVMDTGAVLPALLAEVRRQGCEIIDLTTHRATLEDVFVALTGRNLRDN